MCIFLMLVLALYLEKVFFHINKNQVSPAQTIKYLQQEISFVLHFATTPPRLKHKHYIIRGNFQIFFAGILHIRSTSSSLGAAFGGSSVQSGMLAVVQHKT